MRTVRTRLTNAVIWGLERAIRLLICLGIIWLISWVLPLSEAEGPVLLSEATVQELGSGLAVHIILIILVVYAMGDRG